MAGEVKKPAVPIPATSPGVTQPSTVTATYNSYAEAHEKSKIGGPEAAALQAEWVKNYNRLRNQVENSRDFKFSGAGAWKVYSGAGGIALAVCRGNIGDTSGLKVGRDRADLCKIDQAIKFDEARYSTLNAQLRVFIEGAEVTPWIEGAVTWSYQSTGGQGTCGFTLNNNNDAFTITPQNICAGVNPAGWRIYQGAQGSVWAETSPITWNHDESAKYIIYKTKYNRVNPEGKNGKAKIDKDGIWLYPLEPLSPVFGKHDCIRVFCRLAHVTGASFTDNGQKIDTTELWVPAWSGFIDQVTTNDDLVQGHRTIGVQCYDFKGLLAKMRVRVDHNPQPGGKGDPTGKTEIAIMASLAEVLDCGEGPTRGVKKAEYWALVEQYGAKGTIFELFILLYDAYYRLNKDQTKRQQADNFKARLSRVLTTAATVVAAEFKAIFTINKALNNLTAGIACGLVDIRDAIAKLNAQGGVATWVVVWDSTRFVVENSKGGTATANRDSELRRQLGLAMDTGGNLTQFIAQATNQGSTAQWAAAWNTWYRASVDHIDSSGYTTPGSGVATPAARAATLALVSTIDAWIPAINGLFADITAGGFTTDVFMQTVGATKDSTGAWVIGKHLTYDAVYATRYLPWIDRLVRTRITRYGGDMSGASRGFMDQEFKKNIGGPLAQVIGSLWQSTPGILLGYIKVNPFPDSGWITFGNAVLKAGLAVAGSTETNALKTALDTAVAKMNTTVAIIQRAQQEINRLIEEASRNDVKASATQATAVGKKVLDHRDNALFGNGPRDKSSLADVIVKDVSYKEENAGLFADITRATGRDAHPLAGLPFELAVEWLCLKNTKVWKGFRVNIGRYGDGTLSNWNKTVLFGMFGRPLTYQEVTAMGRGTVMETGKKEGAFSPIQPFLHILLPQNGTGAMTIVQQHIQANTAGSTQFRYETRLALLNEICEVLDYQFFVSPVGDLIFEFPHYAAIPSDFGQVFRGAYIAAKEVQNSKIGHETGPMYTAWILQGMETDAGLTEVAGTLAATQMNKEVIVLENVARRLGANPRYINLKIPGTGANVQVDALGGLGTPKQQLLAYAYLAIQRDIGKSETVAVEHPYRPYLVANRPFWLVHRQRIGLISSVDYSVEVHRGAATARTELGYIRRLFRDGTYRNAAGGWRMPVDYSGINAGSVPTIVKFGSGNSKMPTGGSAAENAALAALWAGQNHGTLAPSAGAPKSCGPALKNAWIMAGANYDDAAAGLSGSAASLRIQRDDMWAPNPGEKDSAYDTRGSGLVSKEPEKKITAFTGFKNPFTFGLSVGRVARGVKAKIGMDNFGFVGRGGDDPHHTTQSMHPGIDIPVSEGGTHYVLAPIPLTSLVAKIVPFNGNKKTVERLDHLKWAERYNARPVIPQWSMKPFMSKSGATDSGGRGAYYIDWEQYNIKIRNQEVPVSDSFGPEGLRIAGLGWIALPEDPGAGKVLCRLTYMHLKDMVYPSTGADMAKKFYGGATLTTCEAGTKLAAAGCSGNAISAHLHFNMDISYKNYKNEAVSDLKAFEAARKATLEYLRATLLARITGGLGGGTVENGKVSESWRRYMGAKGEVSMAEALKFAENIVAKKLKEYLVPVDKTTGVAWVTVNPYLFFSPDQLVTPLPREYTESIKDKDYEVDVAQVCGRGNSAAEAQMERDARKCLQGVLAMSQGSARETALAKCKNMIKSNRELLALQVTNPTAAAEALARMMAERNNKPGAGAAAPAGK